MIYGADLYGLGQTSERYLLQLQRKGEQYHTMKCSCMRAGMSCVSACGVCVGDTVLVVQIWRNLVAL